MPAAELTAAEALALPGPGRPSRPPADVPKLKGMQKAAVLMVSLGEDRAAEIFRHLSANEAEALSLEIAKAGRVPSEVCKAVVDEAVENVMAEEYMAEGGVEYARTVLEKSLG